MLLSPIFLDLLQIGLEIQSAEEFSVKESLTFIDEEFAASQGVAAFILDGLNKVNVAGVLPDNLVSRQVKINLYVHTMQVEQLCKAQYADAAELSALFASEGVRTVVLKGIALGECYPNPLHRPCGDFDCYLMGDYAKGNELVQKAGAEVEFQSYKHSHIEYKGLIAENHQFLTALRGDKRMKRFEQLLRTLLEVEGTKCIGNTCMECPSPLFNALFLTHHGREHFVFEGITLRHLCDWGMLLHKHGAEIDWKLFCKHAEVYGLRDFADAMTCVAEELLGIKVPAGYDVRRDGERLAVLRESLMMGVEQPKSGSSLLLWRWNKVLRLKRNAQRFRLFMDVSLPKYVERQLWGIVFDKKVQMTTN